MSFFKHPEPNFEKGFFVDWLRFVIKPDLKLFDFEAMIGRLTNGLGGSSEGVSGGLFGYSHQVAIAGTGSVNWNSQRPDMGIMVELPASALRTLHDQNISPYVLVDGLLLDDYNVVIKRFDLAKDLDKPILSRCLSIVFDKLNGNENDESYTSPSEKISYNFSHKKACSAETLYIGSRHGACMVRIYDKKAQLVQASLGCEQDVWERLEYQFNSEGAEISYRLWRCGEQALLRAMILKRFRVCHNYSNLSMAETSSWWLEVIDTPDEPANMGITNAQKPLIATLKWLEKSVFPSILAIVEAFELNASEIMHIMKRLSKKRPERLLNLLKVLDSDLQLDFKKLLMTLEKMSFFESENESMNYEFYF